MMSTQRELWPSDHLHSYRTTGSPPSKVFPTRDGCPGCLASIPKRLRRLLVTP